MKKLAFKCFIGACVVSFVTSFCRIISMDIANHIKNLIK